jgi:hypothetical protein
LFKPITSAENHVFPFLEPTWLPWVAASLGRRHRRAAFHVRNASVLKQYVFMHLVKILLPFNDNSGRPFAAEKYAAVRQHLTERFGGLTAFTRSPAQGTKTGGGKTVHHVVFEVMTETLNAGWWKNYRLQLERDFRQMKS